MAIDVTHQQHDPSAVRSVQVGVYFQPPQSLPRGRHGMTGEQVIAAQRERLMVAFTELLAARGYAALRVGDIVQRAGVSRAAFYACFDDLGTCADEAYERFIAVLLRRVVDGLHQTDDFARFALSALEAYLRTLEQDPVVSRAFQVEMDAAGAVARGRRREALARFADVLHARHEELRGVDERLGPLPHAAHLGLVYAVRQLASDVLEQNPAPDMSALLLECAACVGAIYLGDATAVAVAPPQAG